MKTEEIENIFTYHAPWGDQAERYAELRNAARNLGLMINEMCPESREKSLAITNLQHTIMWAIAAIALTEKEKR